MQDSFLSLFLLINIVVLLILAFLLTSIGASTTPLCLEILNFEDNDRRFDGNSDGEEDEGAFSVNNDVNRCRFGGVSKFFAASFGCSTLVLIVLTLLFVLLLLLEIFFAKACLLSFCSFISSSKGLLRPVTALLSKSGCVCVGSYGNHASCESSLRRFNCHMSTSNTNKQNS